MKAGQKKLKASAPDPGWDGVRDIVISMDGGRCRVCGTMNALHVHHIVYRSERQDDSPENLITLCQKHHDLIHSNKDYYQPECQRIVALRQQGNIFERIRIES